MPINQTLTYGKMRLGTMPNIANIVYLRHVWDSYVALMGDMPYMGRLSWDDMVAVLDTFEAIGEELNHEYA
jgi:hypothetical protein